MTLIRTERQFTTFEVARACGVFHTTVINWVNKGKLKASLTPGGHRRIKLSDLLSFMEKFDMPIPADLVSRLKRVLIVEDDAAIKRLLSRALEPLTDVQVQVCTGGLEALMEIGKEAPDLLLLDVRIPQINGLEVCRVLRAAEHTRAVRIIAISGEALSSEEEAFLKKEADAFFRKPLSTAALRAKAAQLLDVEAAPEGR